MKKLLSPWWAIITLALVIGIRVADPSFIESVRLRYFDQLITSKGVTQSEQIHVVNIDDAYIKQKGQFPFPRGEYAKLIETLYQHGAGLVVFNVYLADPDRFGQDSFLSSILKKYPVVLPHAATAEVVESKHIPFRPGVAVVGGDSTDVGVRYGSIDPIIKQFNQSAAGVGVINTLPEIDGVTRRIPLFVNAGGQLFPSISMEALRVASGDPSFQVKVNDFGIEAVRIPQFGKITTDQMGRVWIDWSRKPIEHAAGRLPDNFNGGVVIVGLTAKGLNNPVATPLGSVYPHYVQSSVLDTLISSTNISRPDYMDGLEVITLAVIGILLITLSRWTYVGLGFTAIAAIAVVPVTRYVFSEFATLVDATMVLGGVVLVALHCYGIKFVSEFLQKQAIKKQFAGYCSKEVVEMLQKDPDLIKRGVRKDVSVMFSDLRGFTPIGEHYGDDVGGLGKYMNGYMDAISKPILDNKGMVIKYVGDASMHIHGAPIDDPDHARTIVAVGLQMLDAVDAYTKEMEAQGLPPAAMGWGVNSGIGFIGEMGSTDRHSYDILGDMVSTAARLEARCKAYGVLCIIGAETYKRTKDDFFYLLLDNLQPKGKTVADLIYTALRTKGVDYTSDRIAHNDMHKLYKQKKFDEAAAMCKAMKGAFGGQMDKYYKIWIERCEFMKQQDLPANWNGEFIAHEK